MVRYYLVTFSNSKKTPPPTQAREGGDSGLDDGVANVSSGMQKNGLLIRALSVFMRISDGAPLLILCRFCADSVLYLLWYDITQ